MRKNEHFRHRFADFHWCLVPAALMDFTRPDRWPVFLWMLISWLLFETSVWITAVFKKHLLSKWTITRLTHGQEEELWQVLHVARPRGTYHYQCNSLCFCTEEGICQTTRLHNEEQYQGPNATWFRQLVSPTCYPERTFFFSQEAFAKPSGVCRYTLLGMLLLLQSHKLGSMLQAQNIQKILFSTSLLENPSCWFPCSSKTP